MLIYYHHLVFWSFYFVSYFEILYCRDKCLQKMDGSLSDDWESFARPGESLENFHEERAVKEESLMLEELKEERNMTEFR